MKRHSTDETRRSPHRPADGPSRDKLEGEREISLARAFEHDSALHEHGAPSGAAEVFILDDGVGLRTALGFVAGATIGGALGYGLGTGGIAVSSLSPLVAGGVGVPTLVAAVAVGTLFALAGALSATRARTAGDGNDTNDANDANDANERHSAHDDGKGRSFAQRLPARYGHVQRVGGRDAYEVAVTFAGYRDAGLDQGYWISSGARDFGWGIAEAGHNFTFADPNDWQQAVTGSLLSHMGKHGPMLLVRPGDIPESVARYLQTVQPTASGPTDILVNHGWILGDTRRIGWSVQADIDILLGTNEAADR
jgi:hypothetical protein